MFDASDRRILRQMEQRNRREDPAWVAKFDVRRPALRSSWFVLSSTRHTYTAAILAVMLLMAAALFLGLGPLAFACGTVACATCSLRRLAVGTSVRSR